MRGRSLWIIGAMVLLAGCATNPFRSDVDRLQKAIADGDVKKVEKIIDGGVDADPGGFEEFYDVKDKARRLLSRHHLEIYLNRVSEDEVTLREFDSYCRENLPDFVSGRLGDPICSKEARSVIKKKEVAAQIKKERAEADKRRKENDEIRAEIESGEREITTLREARAYHQPINDEEILMSPSVNGGDGKYYLFSTPLTDKRGDTYISWWPDASINMKGGAIMVDPALVEEGIRFGDEVTVIGKYVRNQSVTMASGAQAQAPVFENAYIFQ